MYTPGFWQKSGDRLVQTVDGKPVCLASSDGNANLLRCAADMYEFIQYLEQSGMLAGRHRDRAQRLLIRASGIGA